LPDPILPLKNVCEVSSLIVANVPEAFCAEQVHRGKAKQPPALKLPLGWSLIGPASSANKASDASGLHAYARRLVTRAAAAFVEN